MRRHFPPVFVLILVAVTGVYLFSQQEKVPVESTIEELVADLGHPVFAVREKAQRELWNRGDVVIPALEKALSGDNPEVVRRARELLGKFSWGIRPDSPPEVLKLLRQFQTGDADAAKNMEIRKAAVLAIVQQGPKGLSVARALLAKDFTPDVREQLISQVTAVLRREIPLRLFEGKTEEAADLIALHAAGSGSQGAADYATYQLLTGKLQEAIRSAEAAKQTVNQKRILAHLYRANGNWSKARAEAAELPIPSEAVSPVELLREDEGDWSTLAETVAFGGVNHPDAVRLTYLRLAGREREFDAMARTVAKSANEFSPAGDVFEVAVALFANHRAEEATRILHDRKMSLGLLGEVLIARLRYKEALGLLDADARKTLPPEERLAFDLRRARILMLAGRRDDAVQLFTAVADGLRPEGLRSAGGREISIVQMSSIRSLLRAELRMGLKDLATEHAAQFLSSGTFARLKRDPGESFFEVLFGQDATSAGTLFTALQDKKLPGGTGATLKRTRDLLDGRADTNAVNEALKAIRDTTQTFQFSRSDIALESADAWKVRKYLATAAVCRAAGRDVEADAAYKQAAEFTNDAVEMAGARTWAYGVSDAFRPYIEWGEFLHGCGRFHESSSRLLEGWKRFPDQPLLLFLSGKSLVRAGDVKEGNRRIELSHWVALGQERIRGKFLDELVRRGEATAAKREIELVERGCWCHDHYYGNVMNQASQAAALNRDFTTAERCRQRSLLVILKTPDVFFAETASYMTVPHDLLVYRARARLAAGKVDEAVGIAREILAITPGHIDLVSAMVPELERLGKKAEAYELFGTAWSAYEEVLRDFPNSAPARNSLASLAANCGRELDKGLAFATLAVKADPTSVPFRETLAEVYFRKGDREKSLEVMVVLAKENPQNPVYRRQLIRYRSGTIDSPKPDRED